MPEQPGPATLSPTALIDCEDAQIIDFARAHDPGGADHERAAALYLAVRDVIRYDPYRIDLSEFGMRASTTLKQGHGWCVNKAALLAAVCRAAGLHARLGYSDVRNHLSTERLRQTMRTDVFIWHGYTDLWLGGRWVKATPAFNKELCERFGLLPLEFDGSSDSLYHPFDKSGQRHMEYIAHRGTFEDMPLAQIRTDFQRVYPHWMALKGSLQGSSFAQDAEHEAGTSGAGT